MEAGTVATAPPEPTPSYDGVAEATRTAAELFQWSTYVHVGAGAEECENALDGRCREPGHFHAWLCLPNQFQIRDISDKAQAAKARKARALRDPQSDSNAVLEDELDTLRLYHFDELIEARARFEVDNQLVEIVRKLQEDERFEHHAQDAEELNRLRELPEEDRDSEEVERLEADMLAYGEQLHERIEERVKAEMERLRARPVDAVMELERRSRIDDLATEAFLHTYYTWAIYVGTRQPTAKGFPSERKFPDPNLLRLAPPEVVEALRSALKELENRKAVRGDAAGN